MPDWTLVNRSHVLAAMAEYDRLEAREFHRRYGFTRAKFSTVWHSGNEYDPPAVLGAAYLHATGRAATAGDLEGEEGAAKVLTGLGFDVVVDEEALAAAAARPRRTPAAPRAAAPGPQSNASRSTRAAAPRKAPAAKRVTRTEQAPKVCPTCYMALPATGICDNCD